MGIVTVGILAHVNTGKTSLTERNLFETGGIPAVERVDQGPSRTDALASARARGLTIPSAGVSFQRHEPLFTRIDTPGHPDIVAEVVRSLGVPDGVVPVVSAVEGVRAQTRRQARAVRSADLPMLIFVNTVDRLGARGETGRFPCTQLGH